jgi:hypothetical protein
MEILNYRNCNIRLGELSILAAFFLIVLSRSVTAQIKSEMIFEFQTNHVHSSSIVELPNGGLLTAWFEIRDSGERANLREC